MNATIYDADSARYKPYNKLDVYIKSLLDSVHLTPAPLCSDSVFVRRVYLDIIGRLPSYLETQSFLENSSEGKRSQLIDRLVDSDDFAIYYSLKWKDLLRVKSEFPINLWPNGVQVYSRWIDSALLNNMPYDKFAYRLLTSSGSNFKNPPSNFFRALQDKSPSGIASAVAQTFLGFDINNLPNDEKENFIKFYSKVMYKHTEEWKEFITYIDFRDNSPVSYILPNGKKLLIKGDPRKHLAQWIIYGKNSSFSKNIINKIFFWLFNQGLITPVDDIYKKSPISDELMNYLVGELKESNYNLRHIFKILLKSRTYQQSPIPSDLNNSDNYRFFAVYPVKRLSAEVIADVLNVLFTNTAKLYSQVPEPYTFIPSFCKYLELDDASISTPFLEMFGRPTRDTGLEKERNNSISSEQRLFFINSTILNNKLKRAKALRETVYQRKNIKDRIDFVYLTFLSRYPTAEEKQVIHEQLLKGHRKFLYNLCWCLVNSKEFLYNH
jgi:hypothetical protein